jgi:hypothetical protein
MKKSGKFSVLGSVLVAVTLLASSAFADVLQLVPSGRTIEDVAISSSASATVQGRHFGLTTVGAGLRSKRVAIINVKVYVAQLMVSDASRFVHSADGALASMADMSQVAIRLDFLRGVDADTVQSSFRDALTANNVDFTSPAIMAFLNAVSAGGDAVDGKALTIVGERLSSTADAITYEDSDGKTTTVTGPTGFLRSIFSIWLGEPADSGVDNLKQALIGG